MMDQVWIINLRRVLKYGLNLEPQCKTYHKLWVLTRLLLTLQKQLIYHYPKLKLIYTNV